MKEFTNEIEIINTLKNWGFNTGEFDEIVVYLAQNQMICGAHAVIHVGNVYDPMITYYLLLTEDGINEYEKWCQENGYKPNLKEGNLLTMDDEDEESVKNTLEEWF